MKSHGTVSLIYGDSFNSHMVRWYFIAFSSVYRWSLQSHTSNKGIIRGKNSFWTPPRHWSWLLRHQQNWWRLYIWKHYAWFTFKGLHGFSSMSICLSSLRNQVFQNLSKYNFYSTLPINDVVSRYRPRKDRGYRFYMILYT